MAGLNKSVKTNDGSTDYLINVAIFFFVGLLYHKQFHILQKQINCKIIFRIISQFIISLHLDSLFFIKLIN